MEKIIPSVEEVSILFFVVFLVMITLVKMTTTIIKTITLTAMIVIQIIATLLRVVTIAKIKQKWKYKTNNDHCQKNNEDNKNNDINGNFFNLNIRKIQETINHSEENYRNKNIIQKESVIQNEYIFQKFTNDNNYKEPNNNNLGDLGNKFNQHIKDGNKNINYGISNHVPSSCTQIHEYIWQNHNNNKKQ